MNISNVKKEIDRVYKKDGIDNAISKCQLLMKESPNNADLHTMLGDLYLEWHLDIKGSKKYIDEAVTEYQRALEVNMDSPKLFFKLGVAFYHKNELEKALNYFHSAIEKDPKYADAYYMAAQTQSKKGNFQHAIDNIKDAIKYYGIKSSKAHYLYHTLLKMTFFKSKEQNKKIRSEYLKSLLLLPFDPEAKKNIKRAVSYFKYAPKIIMALSLANSGNIEKALKIFNDSINEAPGFLPFYNALGDVYYNVRRFEDAIYEYKTAIWIDSMNISAYRGLCRCYEELGDYDAAIETYKTLIEIHPYAPEYHSNLANILFTKGELDEAVSHYQHAINLNPTDTYTSVIAQMLGYIYQEFQENLDAAIAAYQCAYALTPEDEDIYVNLGKAFYDKNDINNSLTIYKRALELKPHSSEIHCNIGYLYWDKGDLEEAIKEYELSIKYNSAYAIPYNNIGVIYLDDYARVQKAIKYFEDAIKANESYALAHYNLARALVFTGEKVEAAKHFQEALDINKITNEMDSLDIEEKIKGLFE